MQINHELDSVYDV